MINPNQLGRRPFPASASQWMLVGLRGGAAPPPGLNDGDPITTWVDSSGNGHDATQAGSARPTFKTNILNGKPVVRFTVAGSSGLNLATAISGLDPWTIFVVMKPTGPTSNFDSIACSGDGAPLGQNFSGAGLYLIIQNRAAYAIYDPAPYRGAFHVYSWRQNSSLAVSTLSVDGTAITPTGSGSFITAGDFNRIGYNPTGASPYSDGDLAEIIFYNLDIGAVSTSNLEKYLGTKFGITVAGGTAVDPSTVAGLVGWWKADSLGS